MDTDITETPPTAHWNSDPPSTKIFPYQNLAPELRNQICEDCLHHDRSQGQVANLSLLRLCHQINRETTGIFNGGAVFYCNVTITTSFRSRYTGSEALHVVGDVKLFHEEMSSPKTCYDACPKGLGKVEQVKVDMELGYCLSPMVQYFVYALMSILAVLAGFGKELVLNLDSISKYHLDQCIKRQLWPLAKLDPGWKLTLSGVPQEVQKEIEEARSGNFVAHFHPGVIRTNLLARWNALQLLCLEAIEAIDGLRDMSEVALAFMEVERCLEGGNDWMTPALDVWLQDKIVFLEQFNSQHKDRLKRWWQDTADPDPETDFVAYALNLGL